MGFEIQTDVAPQEQDVKNKFHLSTLEPRAAVVNIINPLPPPENERVLETSLSHLAQNLG